MGAKDISDILGQHIHIAKGAGAKIEFGTDMQTLDKIRQWFDDDQRLTAGKGQFVISQIEYRGRRDEDYVNVELRIWGV